MAKRLVFAFDGHQTLIDPTFCDHQNAIVTYDEADEMLKHCPDCDSTIDGDGNIIKSWNGEIPFEEA